MFAYILTNWKTSLAGLAVALTVAIRDAYISGTLHKSTIASVIFIAIWGFVTKDANVTGGTAPNAANDPGAQSAAPQKLGSFRNR